MNSASLSEHCRSTEVFAAGIRDSGQLLLREIDEVESYMSKFKIKTLKLHDFKKDIMCDVSYAEKV